MNALSKFFAEMKRRKVFHVGSLYLITGWGASLGAAELFPAFGIPEWVVRAFVIVVALGFPFALILAWAFEITPDGVVLDPGIEKKDKVKAAATETEMEDGSATTVVQSEGIEASWESEGEQHSRDFYKDFVLGRGREADVRIVNSRISRLHAKVKYERGAWWILDLASRNGTILNGELLDGPGKLLPSNQVVLYEGGAPIVMVVRESADQTVFD